MDYQAYEAENFGNVPPPEFYGIALPRDYFEGCNTTPRFLEGLNLTNDFDLCDGCGRHIYGIHCTRGLCGTCRYDIEQIENEQEELY